MKCISLFSALIMCAIFAINPQPTFSQAQLFAPGIISNGHSFGASFSPSGKTVYFVDSHGGRDTLRIMQSEQVKGVWQKPSLAFFASKTYNEIDPFVTPDGRMILFNSSKPTGSGKGFDIYAVEKKGNKWGKPYFFGETINSDSSDFYATMANNGNLYFTSRIGGGNDIYKSEYVLGEYKKPISLGASINTTASESNPFISPKEEYLIFFSDRQGGEGESDLYICFRRGVSWSKPINLGSQVNTSAGEFCPFVDAQGKKLYFSRTEVREGKRIDNIYFIAIKSLNFKKLRSLAVYE